MSSMAIPSSQTTPSLMLKHSSLFSSSRDHHGHSPLSRSGERVYSQANASWDNNKESSSTSSSSDLSTKERMERLRLAAQHAGLSLPQPAAPRHRTNTLMDQTAGIDQLLNLLKSNEFVGHVDPKHHSRYLSNPDGCNQEEGPTKINKRSHRSDGHLLGMKKRY